MFPSLSVQHQCCAWTRYRLPLFIKYIQVERHPRFIVHPKIIVYPQVALVLARTNADRNEAVSK
jgi:hypothetical protein